ncbi:MAG: hypothetical protein F6J90_02275 [Moorea sp. SIOASIH]|uniref:hypothetical protein n=1 Tax=Moorena sp. SIOASIH TaxID=2607817 RepID=UPI0013BE571E|nr:hypothetical protein [Moorena sp. SIOASIH]NEO35197.1 hypothetical protein [Moorena sp. SIOASIH]
MAFWPRLKVESSMLGDYSSFYSNQVKIICTLLPLASCLPLLVGVRGGFLLPLASCLLPLACYLLPTPYSLLPAPCSLKKCTSPN